MAAAYRQLGDSLLSTHRSIYLVPDFMKRAWSRYSTYIYM
jgi:hypothetical protein